MKADILFICYVTLLTAFLNLKQVNGRGLDFGICSEKFFKCQCGSGPSQHIFPVSVKECTFFYKWKSRCSPCNEETEETVCPTYQQCLECELGRCKLCPVGKYGPTCRGVCTCQNGGFCDRDTGACTCVPPYQGVNCQIHTNITVQPLEPKTCLSPESNPFSRFIPSQTPVIDEEFPIGTTLTFYCEKGTILVGRQNITCTSRGHWTAAPPYCDKACRLPSIPPHVTVSAKSSTKSRISVDNWTIRNETVPTGTVLTFGCSNSFFKLSGIKKTYCTARGAWNKNNFPACTPLCGLPGRPRHPYIINGTVAARNAYPWMISLHHWEEEEPVFKCGASIIHESWLITAAHCVTVYTQTTLINASILFPIAGMHNLENEEDSQQELQVSQIYVHPSYNPLTFDSDIALLHLATPLEFNEQVLPVCLPAVNSDIDIGPLNGGMIGKAMGWGYTDASGTLARELQELNLPVVSKNICDDAFRADGVVITNNMFCAGNGTGLTGVCGGDSGGPFLTQSESAGDGMRWYLRGLVSWGSLRGCAVEGLYAGFTNVEMFSNWIEEIMMDPDFDK